MTRSAYGARVKGSGIPLILREAIHKAAASGTTEEQLCERLGISHARFSRWKNGGRLTPDPRIAVNRRFYLNLARFLETDVGEVLAKALLLEDGQEKEISAWPDRSLAILAQSTELSSLSLEAQKDLRTILINLPGNESFLRVLLASFERYVREVLEDEWFTDPGLAVNKARRPSE